MYFYTKKTIGTSYATQIMEHQTGIEPVSLPWQGSALTVVLLVQVHIQEPCALASARETRYRTLGPYVAAVPTASDY